MQVGGKIQQLLDIDLNFNNPVDLHRDRVEQWEIHVEHQRIVRGAESAENRLVDCVLLEGRRQAVLLQIYLIVGCTASDLDHFLTALRGKRQGFKTGNGFNKLLQKPLLLRGGQIFQLGAVDNKLYFFGEISKCRFNLQGSSSRNLVVD